MADLLAPAEPELCIALLPPISRGAHLDGPILYAQRLVELWKVDNDDVLLAQAFRLLEVEAVAGAILRTSVAGNGESGDSRHWHFPIFQDLLPELRELSWQAMLDGRLLVEGIKGVRGKRYRAVLPAELPRRRPHWELSRLCLGKRDEFINVRVRRAPAEPAKQTWRDKPSKTELEAFVKDIALGFPEARDHPETRPTFEYLQAQANARFGMEVPRDDLRAAVDEAAPYLKRSPGQHGRKKSRS
jgi:hypothetical protein